MTDGSPLPGFSLSLLGRFELTGPDGVVDLSNKKLAGLLAYLACTAPKAQPRERLATLLWGSRFETQAKQSLRQAVFRLRKVIGEDALDSDGEFISLSATAVLCDVKRFEALVREGGRDALSAAADLYRGHFIDDVAIGEESWSEWLTAERERLQELALAAMVRLGEQELAAGHAEHALKAGQRANALNNLREDAHRLIMQALAAAGRKAEALKYYEDLVALLKRELNTDPDPASRSLVAELRSTQASPSSAKEVERPPAPFDPSPAEVSPAGARSDNGSPLQAARPGSLEQRQLTIMVCSVAGSTRLTGRHDPEDVHDLVAGFHKTVAETVARFDGFVAQYQGAGALVYFGYPAAQEHDAEQAVRAGLAVIDAVAKMQDGVSLQASVGIATGLVVTGDKAGTGDPRRHAAIGETPGLAARLQAVASPGEVVIAAGTRRLTGRMFDYRALPAIELKGLLPVEAWQVRGETAGVSRFDARTGGALSPFVGRREEIERLLRRWDQARLGEGRVMLLSGEPGIGKSRVAESLLARLENEPHARLRYFCSPHHAHSPLYPIIAQLERAAGFAPGSGDSAKLDRLETLLKPTTTNLPRDVALIAELLGVPADERYPALAVSPQQKREMTLTALLDQIGGLAAKHPVLIVVEDAHWIDPTSLDLLDRMVACAANLPVLLIVTFRPEFEPAWIGQPHVAMLSLSRLGRKDSADIIPGLTNGRTLPDAVVDQILAHTDGVPLFIEELTSSLLESGVFRETTDSYVLDGPLPAFAIPTTLQASLVARLDRLGAVKDVALIGAAIGREFSHELIAAVSDLLPADLAAALQRLTASGLISGRGTPPDAIYTFKHALVQDAAYVTMLRSRRRQLHAGIAKALIERFPTVAESLPEVVARHFTEAGLAGEAIDWWIKAGRLAQARWANREAVEFFEQARHILEALPEDRETLQRALDVRFELKTSLLQLGELEQMVVRLREAEGLARRLDDQRRLGQLSFHLCEALVILGRPSEAIPFGQNAQAIAVSLGDVPLQVTGDHCLAAAYVWSGDFRRAEDILLKVLQLLERELDRDRFGLPGFPAVTARGYLTVAFADQGKFEQGIVHGEEGIRLAEALDHPYSLSSVCWYLAYLQATRGDFSKAISLLERGLPLARAKNLPFLTGRYVARLGYAYALSGRTAEGLPLLEQAVRTVKSTGNPSGLMLLMGEAYVLADRLAEALECAGRSLSLARDGGQGVNEARALWLLGEVTAGRDPPGLAQGHYRNALALAENLGMRPLIAHCHHGLGKLARRMRKRDLARDHFSAATTAYREMSMTYWLERAEGEIS
jgi:class 3 adenylate cyclase/DNA-binding SARP family transcriptional activator